MAEQQPAEDVSGLPFMNPSLPVDERADDLLGRPTFEEKIMSMSRSRAGERAGTEIAQLFVQDIETSVERPAKELKGFSKVFLAPGETTTVTLEMGTDALSFFDERANAWVAKPGAFTIMAGSSSRDIRLEALLDHVP
jgi:beta-glucosidase